MAHVPCQLGSRFSRCPNESAHVCQYCGRNFCPQHAHWVEAHEAVCIRKRCAEKRDDLTLHLAYRERVEQRNHAGLCGVEGCGPHPGFECSLCLGLFCGAHLSNRTYTFRDGWSSVDRPVSICRHCWDRRRVWRHR
ncbi:MAG: hypothetical protein ACR2HN_06865 [Tepidiformaceae bacterium]